jgi:hypothetical protein
VAAQARPEHQGATNREYRPGPRSEIGNCTTRVYTDGRLNGIRAPVDSRVATPKWGPAGPGSGHKPH